MGSGSKSHEDLANPLGRFIANAGFHLLTGGASGVMASTSQAFCEVEGRKGLSIGVIRSATLPELDESCVRKYCKGPVNPWIEIPIYTHLNRVGDQGESFLSRNHINVLTSDILIALPGGAGSLSEIKLRVQYGKKVILFLGNRDVAGMKSADFLNRAPFADHVYNVESIDEISEIIEEISRND